MPATSTAVDEPGGDAQRPLADSSAASPSVDTARRSFTRACLAGGIPGTLVFVWMLTRGTFDLFLWQRVGDFYDAQAHRLLGGHLSVNGLLLGVEAFTVRGNAYMYQGPVPALMRIPIVALAGHHLDGRLTQTSMLVALVVATVFACRLHWRARLALRGHALVSRREAVAVAVFTFVLTGGSILLYEASRAWVYDEALIWGAAFALASIDVMASFVEHPTWRRLGLASFLATCTILTRASIGLGPVAGLALLVVGIAARRWARRSPTADVPGGAGAEGTSRPAPPGAAAARALVRFAPEDAGSARPVGVLGALVAAAAPLVLYAGVNYAKFRSLFSVPFYAQQFSMVDPGRRAFLAANGGTLFGLQFMPTTILQYLRPDALRFTSLFPFVDFAPAPGTIIGNVRFDLFDRTSSLPAAVPFLFVLAVIGLVALFRPAAWRADAPLRHLRVPALAALLGGVTILPFGYIAHRYLADFVPILALAAAVGVQVLLRRAGADRPSWWRPAVAALAVLALFTTWVNFALALRYQREWSYNLQPGVVAGFIGLQQDVNHALGGGPITVARDASLPNGVGRPGKLVVLGNCDALYVSDGLATNAVKTSPWDAVELTGAAGHFVFKARFPPEPVGTRVPIFSTGSPAAPNILVAEYRPGPSILFEYREASTRFVRHYVPFPLDTNKTYSLDISADPRVRILTVTLGDVAALDATYRYPGHDFRFGVNLGTPGVAARFPGTLRRQPVSAPLCRSLVRAGTAAATRVGGHDAGRARP